MRAEREAREREALPFDQTQKPALAGEMGGAHGNKRAARFELGEEAFDPQLVPAPNFEFVLGSFESGASFYGGQVVAEGRGNVFPQIETNKSIGVWGSISVLARPLFKDVLQEAISTSSGMSP